jgi:hypothetical protein
VIGGDNMWNGKQEPVSTGKYSASLKPRYKDIGRLLGEDYKAENGLDVFIDFNTFVSSISSVQKFLNQIPFMDQKLIELDMLSSILTTYLHWKNFTRKWDNVRIYGFVNDLEMGVVSESSHLKTYLIPYVNKFRQDRFKQLSYYWTETVKMVDKILKYVPQMYMIHCNKFDSYVIPNVIDDYSNNTRDRLVVTGNSLMTGYQFMDRTKIIYSKFIGSSMARLTDPIMVVQSVTKIHEDIMVEFTRNKVCYNLLNVIIGDFERGIIGLPQASITSVACSLLRCMERNEIPKDPKSIESVLPIIKPRLHDYLRNAYKLINIDEHTLLIPQSMVERIKSTMVDEYDIDGLSKMSVEDFNLIELL